MSHRAKQMQNRVETNTKFKKLEINLMLQASWTVTKWEEDSQEPIVNKCVKNFFVFLSLIENSCTDDSNYVPILAAAVGFFSTNDLGS